MFLPTVFAVGFSNLPSQREYTFTPGLTVNIPIYPSNAETVRVILGAPAGDPATVGTPNDDNIANYVTLEDPQPDGPPREVIIHMKFPEQLKPGDYKINIAAQDVIIGQGTVSAVASTRLQFTIHVLSPDKRIDILEIRALPVPEGLNANVSVFVVSRTSQDISAIFSEVRVYKNGELISTANSQPVSLSSGSPLELSTKLNTEELRGGEYQVNATVHFDGYSNYTGTEILKIGTLHVNLAEYTSQFTFNTTNQFLFNISNEWNRELRDVYTQVEIGSQSKKSASQNIAPFKKTQYELYFDREEAIKPGTINAVITVTFNDFDPASKTYIAKKESFNASIEVVVPPVPEKKWWEGDMLIYVIIGGIALILIFILILIIVMLLKKKSPSPAVQATRPVAPVQPTQPTRPIQPSPSTRPIQPTQSQPIRPQTQAPVLNSTTPIAQKPVVQENWQQPKK